MSQYHLTVNIDKHEFLNPHKLGDGLNLLEQVNSEGGTLAALHILLACSNGRGAGDIPDGKVYGKRSEAKKKGWRILKEDGHHGEFCYAIYDKNLQKAAGEFIGRWTGDRIAVVGDYTEKGDIKGFPDADILYHLHETGSQRQITIEHWRELATDARYHHKEAKGYFDKAERLEKAKPLKDISDGILPLVEASCGVKITGTGWRDKVRSDGPDAKQDMAPGRAR